MIICNNYANLYDDGVFYEFSTTRQGFILGAEEGLQRSPREARNFGQILRTIADYKYDN